MILKEKFYLSHVTLYAKNWYRKTDSVFEDLRKVLILDDYTPFTDADVLVILLKAYERSFQVSLIDFINDVHQSNCWKVGYYVKGFDWVKNQENLKEYDLYTAIVYKILSDIRFLNNTQWVIKIPRYSKDFKRPEHITIKTVMEFFNYKQKQIV